MARIQCSCGKICRSKTSFKNHVRTVKDGTQHVINLNIRRFTTAAVKPDRRKERTNDGIR